MNQKIICNLLLWSGIILLLLSAWNTWNWVIWVIGCLLVFVAYFFTNEAVERRHDRKMERWKEKHKKRHPELSENKK